MLGRNQKVQWRRTHIPTNLFSSSSGTQELIDHSRERFLNEFQILGAYLINTTTITTCGHLSSHVIIIIVAIITWKDECHDEHGPWNTQHTMHTHVRTKARNFSRDALLFLILLPLQATHVRYHAALQKLITRWLSTEIMANLKPLLYDGGYDAHKSQSPIHGLESTVLPNEGCQLNAERLLHTHHFAQN